MTDRDFAYKILSHDKHQLLEGLVVENTFDQILQPLVEARPPQLQRLDIETVVVDARRETGRWLALDWMRRPTDGLGSYVLTLDRVARLHLVGFREGEFLATERSGGKRAGGPVLLQELLGSLSGRRPIFPEVDLTGRDANRQWAAFWGYLSETYRGNRLWEDVVLFRLSINFGIQPFFRGVWELDHICLYGAGCGCWRPSTSIRSQVDAAVRLCVGQARASFLAARRTGVQLYRRNGPYG